MKINFKHHVFKTRKQEVFDVQNKDNSWTNDKTEHLIKIVKIFIDQFRIWILVNK